MFAYRLNVQRNVTNTLTSVLLLLELYRCIVFVVIVEREVAPFLTKCTNTIQIHSIIDVMIRDVAKPISVVNV